ncbi:MAG: lipid droplet-associated protein, partial [Mycobacterium sp.]
PAATATMPTPAVAGELDYETLTLAQLRARLQSLDVDELEALLAYEEATKARAPFQTLLANRITRATAK